MSLKGAVEVCRKKPAPPTFILYDNNLEAGHPSKSSARVSCFRNGNNLFYIVSVI